MMKLSRRQFLHNGAATAAGVIGLFSWTAFSSSSRALQSISVYVMKPVPGWKYSNAARSHMKNKLFPSPEAAAKRLPYKGFSYRLEQKQILIPSNLTKETLFAGRTDLDRRVLFDEQHLQRKGAQRKHVFDS